MGSIKKDRSAFIKFRENLGWRIKELYNTDAMIHRAIDYGFDCGMSEVEVLTSIIYVQKQIADEETKRKLDCLMSMQSNTLVNQ